jgi:hypothetical protein
MDVQQVVLREQEEVCFLMLHLHYDLLTARAMTPTERRLMIAEFVRRRPGE